MAPQFPVIPSDRADDIHHLPYAERADLVLFMAGNQFMVMEQLITLFQSEYPQVKRIFYETLPPGLELKQILAGGAIFKGRPIPPSRKRTKIHQFYSIDNRTATLQSAWICISGH